MCHTAIISDKIVNLGTRSYRQRLEAISGMGVTNQKIARLNKDLDDLYELLYTQFNSITEKNRLHLKSLLQELLKTVKALYVTCKKAQTRFDIEEETERLGMNYSAIYELYEDINNFRTGSLDNDMNELLSQAAAVMHNVS